MFSRSGFFLQHYHIQNTRRVRNGDIYRQQGFFKGTREHHKLTAVSFSMGPNDFICF